MTIKKYERLRNDIYTAIYRSKTDHISILMTSSLFNELLTVFTIITDKEHIAHYYFLGYPVSCVFVPDDGMKWWIICGSGEG